ncbi:MAG: hypothetical protein FIA95_14610 [Gemmatimonadetes bacterium]|nr:hypothetical protein [Gemmatimonadota bacterium]
MGQRMSRRRTLWGGIAFLAVLLAGCGGGSTTPDPEIGALVGDWDATRLVLTSVANPQVKSDLIALGATFRLNIQPSGQYTAILLYSQQSSTEIGVLTVSGNTITMKRDFPSKSTSAALFALAGDRMTLDGDSGFDFNLDGTQEPALAHFELLRR